MPGVADRGIAVAGLLQQILDLLGLGKSPTRRRAKPHKSPEALKRSGLVRCRACRAEVRRGTPRCPQCGARVISPSRRSPTADLGFTDLQERLLLAASTSESRTIHVLPATGSAEGEVKAGSLRISGNEVLTAVEQLRQAGLVEPADDNSFALTDKGRKAVARLAEPI